MDYQATLYDPVYRVLGVAAVLDLGTDGEVSLTVIYKAPSENVGDVVLVATNPPSCRVRMRELAAKDVTRADLDGRIITLNQKTYTVVNTELLPAPTGEADGELRMVLSE